MSRDLNPTEKFLSERLAALSVANPDPFMYDIATGHFMEEVARAVALVLGESAPPGRKLRFFNEFYMKLAAVDAGVPQEVRLSPPAPPVPNLPPPEQHLEWVQQHLGPLEEPVELVTAPPPAPVKKRRTRVVTFKALRGTDCPDVFLEGQDIAEARLNEGMTPDQLGREVGVSGAQISRWERGISFPKRGEYQSLRATLKLPKEGPPYE
jgi:DNA-binding transcriptional regulator YiaG